MSGGVAHLVFSGPVLLAIPARPPPGNRATQIAGSYFRKVERPGLTDCHGLGVRRRGRRLAASLDRRSSAP
jgi:hypothetical protein